MDFFSGATSIAGVLIGALVSFLITRHYYRRSSLSEKDVINLFYSIETVYLRSKYPDLFESPDSFTKEFDSPDKGNPDIPYMMTLKCSSESITCDSKNLVLFRVKDLGRNFFPEGVSITEDQGIALPFKIEGFGWFSFILVIPSNAPLGKKVVSFRLEDKDGNLSRSSFEFTVTDRR